MDILFISALEGGKYSGPLHSVPRQVMAQGKFDNVYWINLTDIGAGKLNTSPIYHYVSLKDFMFEKLPEPFNKPDLVVFEEFFKLECCLVARKCCKNKIPYIIIPRCQMTKQYLINKKIKKKVACTVMFNAFARNAKAVHFLSEQERLDSYDFFKGRYFIEANGIDIPEIKEQFICKNYIQGIFIGRYSVWQKGLDILIEAIARKRETLSQHNFKFLLYGPDERTGNSEEIKRLVNKFQVSEIVLVNGAVFGEDKKKVLMNADFFIHTSRFEGMPMSVLEALSYGLPCFVTQGSNMRELVEENEAGWGTDVAVDAVANKLEEIALMENCWDKKRKNAIELAKLFSWEQIAQRCHIQYRELLK